MSCHFLDDKFSWIVQEGKDHDQLETIHQRILRICMAFGGEELLEQEKKGDVEWCCRRGRTVAAFNVDEGDCVAEKEGINNWMRLELIGMLDEDEMRIDLDNISDRKLLTIFHDIV